MAEKHSLSSLAAQFAGGASRALAGSSRGLLLSASRPRFSVSSPEYRGKEASHQSPGCERPHRATRCRGRPTAFVLALLLSLALVSSQTSARPTQSAPGLLPYSAVARDDPAAAAERDKQAVAFVSSRPAALSSVSSPAPSIARQTLPDTQESESTPLAPARDGSFGRRRLPLLSPSPPRRRSTPAFLSFSGLLPGLSPPSTCPSALSAASPSRSAPASLQAETENSMWCSTSASRTGSRAAETHARRTALFDRPDSRASSAQAVLEAPGHAEKPGREKGEGDASSLDRGGAHKNAEDPLAEYVKKHGGKRVIRRVLIANNGMAATKSIFSMRQWAYMELGDDKLLEFVVMATPEDMRANPEYVRRADKIVEVPGGPNRNNYANVDLICQIAAQEKVDAVWPGWGHASENPNLPRRLKELGITFIGPNAAVMAALGDKIAANILAQTAGVPSIPWSGDSLKAHLDASGSIPKEVFQQATVQSVEDCEKVAARIGYPMMIKASEGGGGKGIRMVDRKEQLRAAYEQVVAEVPGSPVFMMQLCTGARHIEVQILGDEDGQAVGLSGRDCSTQRRFQKIFEEAPPTSVVPPHTMKEMERAAQRLTQSLGYVGAGTVEYLYNREQNKFFFLELNPRLQVEHPVSEGITGVNLPAAQLQVAMGIPLWRIPDIRRFFGREPNGTDKIDFMKEDYVPIKRHVLASRITAENPDEGFKPTSGRVDRLEFQPLESVWGYFSVGASGGIHEYADSQFGHIFAAGQNREEARKRLVLGLKRVDVRGEIRTPIEYLVQLLENEDFKENRIDTSWLDKLIKQRKSLGEKKVDKAHVVLAAVLFRAIRALKDKEQQVLSALQRGQRYIHDLASLNSISQEIVYEDQRFTFQVVRTGPQLYLLKLNGQEVECLVREQPDGSFIVLFPGEKSHKFNGREEPLGLRLQVDGTTVLLANVFDPSELRSDVTGKLVRYLVPERAKVNKGEPYVEVEAMKMVMTLTAGESGVLSHAKSPGSVISTGDILATLELEDPSRVKKINDFTGVLDLPGARKRLAQAEEPDEAASAGEKGLRREESASVAAAPTSLFGSPEEEAAMRLRLAMEGYEQDIESTVQKLAFPADVDPKNLREKKEKLTELLVELFQSFLNVDEYVSSLQGSETGVDGREGNAKGGDAATLLKMKLAHSHLQPRIQLVLSLLRALHTFPNYFPDWTMPVSLELCLKRLSALHGREYGPVALEAVRLLRSFRVAPFDQRVQLLKEQLRRIPSAGAPSLSGEAASQAERVARSSTTAAGIDLLSHLFGDAEVGRRALEVAVRRHHRGFPITALRTEDFEVEREGKTKKIPIALWSFRQGDLSGEAPLRSGVMGAFGSLAEIRETGQRLLERLRQYDEEERRKEAASRRSPTWAAAPGAVGGRVAPADSSHRQAETDKAQEPRNVFVAALATPLDGSALGATPSVTHESSEHGEVAEEQLRAEMTGILKCLEPSLRSADVRLAAVHVPQAKKPCRMFNFLAAEGFEECRIRRDLCPTVPSLMELKSLEPAFNLTRLDALDPNTQAYLALPKKPSELHHRDAAPPSSAALPKKRASATQAPQNVFVRRLIFEDDVKSDLSDLPRIFLDLLDVLDRCSNDPRVSAAASGRLFVHIVSPLSLKSAKQATEYFQKVIKRFQSEHNERLLRLRVDQIEVKMHLRKSGEGGGEPARKDNNQEKTGASESFEKEKERLQVLRLSVSSHQGRWLQADAAEDVPHVLTGDPIAHRRFVFTEEGGKSAHTDSEEGGSGKTQPGRGGSETAASTSDDDAPRSRRRGEKDGDANVRVSVGLKALRGGTAEALGGRDGEATRSPSLSAELADAHRKDKEVLSLATPASIAPQPDLALGQEKGVDPYPEFDRVAVTRSAARRAGSTYIFDFLGLLEIALLQSWQMHLKEKGEKDGGAGGWDDAVPRDLFKAEEFKISADGKLYLDPDWSVADNKIGMVGFLITLKTPEYPSGRQMVLLGNDITFQGGSFGVPEHRFFTRVSEFSRLHGLPRVYIACNSGARIGLYEDLKDKIRVEWNDPGNPSLGFKYLYLDAEDRAKLPEGVVTGHFVGEAAGAADGDESRAGAEHQSGGGRRRFVIDAIIGEPDKFIGVENLRGSGTIAGETSRAYDETFTLSYVTGRSVGIGAYIVRLAQRTIQMIRGPLLLTGYQALNKLLGREVYASQDQLGGPEVMYRNGVSHLVVQNDQEGMKEVLRWLSYTPKTARDSVQTAQGFTTDPIDRDVEFEPTKMPYDVRHMLAGYYRDDGSFVSGFFDRNSFKEYLAGWGKSVVVGRARLGGIPFGTIAVETRLTEARQPADPSSPDSRENVVMHAGQVWFPDSAYKTAQAINDFNRGENLPLMIFANWRGFSGGTRDMFEEILKFGSMIVDALRTYKQPVFIYIPPHGELRGGSWVVVDPTINPQRMEMYADTNARGGVLEPPGICEIKYRAADQKALMHRIDDVLKELDKQLQDCQTDSDAIELKEKIRKREAALEPLYLSIARFYADLHDRPERMKARGVISSVVDWKKSREFFYWRARRRLLQDDLEGRLLAADPRLDFSQARARIEGLLDAHGVQGSSDKAVSAFFTSVQGKATAQELVDKSQREGAVDKIREILASLPKEAQKGALEDAVKRAA
ncbi:acetyl-CoA carboxylase ACC1 [Besnoitia besnoiti]|uniref:Acetyl-CoA carboxylase ACC1 n=1 Tax=Besnoitia besnoiti TaxID=94643 RepID=A0A2A9M7C9_BESBE|nr:acetyl-CoA carboxylase ACC1 [Besnoitia besnoiti]PFH33849.1 acetyl-CoA carboxylase ACC1 [Besnoitia besnoiti]